MKTQIRQIQDYFIGKILAGEFKVETCREHVIIVNVHGYIFSFWGNVGVYGGHQYLGTGDYFMELNIEGEALEQVANIMKVHHDQYIIEVIRNKENELNELKLKHGITSMVS